MYIVGEYIAYIRPPLADTDQVVGVAQAELREYSSSLQQLKGGEEGTGSSP